MLTEGRNKGWRKVVAEREGMNKKRRGGMKEERREERKE